MDLNIFIISSDRIKSPPLHLTVFAQTQCSFKGSSVLVVLLEALIRTDHIILVLHTASYHKNRATQSIQLVLCIPNMTMHSQSQTLATATDFYLLDLD